MIEEGEPGTAGLPPVTLGVLTADTTALAALSGEPPTGVLRFVVPTVESAAPPPYTAAVVGLEVPRMFLLVLLAMTAIEQGKKG